MNPSSPLPLLVAGFFSITNSLAQEIVRGPYLQLGTPNSMIVRWRTDIATDSKLWYGDSPTNLTSSESVSGNRTDHEINIMGLDPGTTYFYAVGNSTGTLSYDLIGDMAGELAGEDADHYFNTTPVTGSAPPVSIWVLGDAGTHDMYQRGVRDAFYTYNGSPHVDLILALGDNAYEDGLDSEYQIGWFENMYETSLINSVLWPVVGNHDLHFADSETETGPYYDIFNCPRNGEAGGVASGTEAYYSFNHANIHFISINSEDVDQTPGSPMLNWLQNDLNSNTQQWTIAMIHRPAYYSSSKVRENMVPMLESAGVDLVLYGHRHVYQRSYLMDGHYGDEGTFDSLTMTIDGGDGNVNGDGPYVKQPSVMANSGTIHLISGSAGKVSQIGTIHPFLVSYIGSPTLGSLHINVDASQMDVKFITDQTTVHDHFTITKGVGAWPNVTLTGPDDGTIFPIAQSITLTADASDPDGQITQVEFFANGISLGTDLTAPYSLNWTPTKGTYQITAKATDNDLNIIQSLPRTVHIEIFQRIDTITSNSDDAEERVLDGKVKLYSSDLEIGEDDTLSQIIGLRFTDLSIPQNAEIENAHIQFTADESTNVDPVDLTVFGVKHPDPTTFVNSTNDISNRMKTTASVSWQPDLWTENSAGSPQETPDLKSILQEIVNQASYSAASAIAVTIEGMGTRVAIAHDKDSLRSAELHVVYSVGNCTETDGDGICDEVDNCPAISNPMQEDADGDGIGDVCDPCPMVSADPLVLNEVPIPSGTFLTTSTINSAGLVATDSMVVFKAGEAICLNPTFETAAGGIFQITIDGCPTE